MGAIRLHQPEDEDLSTPRRVPEPLPILYRLIPGLEDGQPVVDNVLFWTNDDGARCRFCPGSCNFTPGPNGYGSCNFRRSGELHTSPLTLRNQ